MCSIALSSSSPPVRFKTKATGLSSSAAAARFGSSCIVRVTNFTSGAWFLIFRTASNPVKSGIETSVTITSGLRLIASSRMARPSATTPMNDKRFFEVEAQSLSEDRVIISDEDTQGRRMGSRKKGGPLVADLLLNGLFGFRSFALRPVWSPDAFLCIL